MICPNCGNKMCESGGAWSGNHRVQNYRCNKCGRRKMDSKVPYIPRNQRSKKGGKMPNLIDIAIRHFTPRPPVDHLIGNRYITPDGTIWQLVSHNDLNVPYFSKVKSGKVQKRQYVVPWLELEEK